MSLKEQIDKVLDVHIDWIQGTKRGNDHHMKPYPYYLTAPFRELLLKQILSKINKELEGIENPYPDEPREEIRGGVHTAFNEAIQAVKEKLK